MRTEPRPSTRASLAESFGRVAAAAGATTGAEVRVALDDALETGHTLTRSAAAATAGWKAKTEPAIMDRTRDTTALHEYAATVRTETSSYAQMRVDLSNCSERVEDPTCYYRDTAGWQDRTSESRAISRTYSAALAMWNATVEADKTTWQTASCPPSRPSDTRGSTASHN